MSGLSWQFVLFGPLVFPIFLLCVAGVLRLIGVPKDKVAEWALRQANRQRLTDLIRAARGLPEGPDDKERP